MTGWREISVTKLAVPEASGIAYLGDERFLVVDDDRGVFLAHKDGTATLIARRGEPLQDLEGICLGPDGSVYVLCEETGAVLSFALEQTAEPPGIRLGEPRPMGRLEKIARTSKKGWEGIALWPGSSPRLLASHEGKPRRIGVFALDGLATEHLLRLPADIKHTLEDISDLCVDPLTRNLILLSDESSAFAEVVPRLELDAPAALEAGPATELVLGKKEKAEGLCFDEHGVLWIVSDGDPHLRAFSRA